MPLTNPNKVVTEERLSEFYGQILPYMGGMPDVLANKFSKGDLYSTDEKMIGQWIDGKPLYQKVIQLTSSNIPNENIKYVNHGISDLGYVVYLSGMIRQKDNVSFTSLPRIQDNTAANLMALDINKTQLLLKGRGTDFTYTFNGGHVVILYTKTTDSPISIGSDTDYSTDEKIVGTWLNGEPLYQRTYYFSTPLNITTIGTSGAQVCSIPNLGIVTHIETTSASANDFAWNPVICWKDGSTNVKVSSTHSFSLRTCTLRYTKTTD